MSDLEKFRGIKGVADAYVQMRKKEAEIAQAQVTATETVVEKETIAPPADATVQPEQTNESVNEDAVRVGNSGANSFKTTTTQKKTMAQHSSLLKTASTKAKSLMQGDEAEEDEEEKPKKKKNVTINPELSEDGHTDVSSAMRKCKTIAEDAAEILTALQGMNPEEGLPSWWMNAIAVSANELNQMRDYIKNPKEE
jgi:hypothetical protein